MWLELPRHFPCYSTTGPSVNSLVSPAQKTVHSTVSIAALLCISHVAADDLQHRFDALLH